MYKTDETLQYLPSVLITLSNYFDIRKGYMKGVYDILRKILRQRYLNYFSYSVHSTSYRRLITNELSSTRLPSPTTYRPSTVSIWFRKIRGP